jgi:hypothetical protein
MHILKPLAFVGLALGMFALSQAMTAPATAQSIRDLPALRQPAPPPRPVQPGALRLDELGRPFSHREITVALGQGFDVDPEILGGNDELVDLIFEQRTLSGRDRFRLLSGSDYVARTPQTIVARDIDTPAPTRADCVAAVAPYTQVGRAVDMSHQNAPRYYCVRTLYGNIARLTLLADTPAQPQSLTLRIEIWQLR